MERLKEFAPWLNVWPEKEYDPNDPKADAEGYVWVISVASDSKADKSYLCTDGHIH
jgi:hypothetical protein